jgi:hypothetical protein
MTYQRHQSEDAALKPVAAAADDSPYKPGDPPPGGYLNWHAWAEVQDKAGLRQKKCRQCGLWKFPQELSGLACSKCSASGVALPLKEQQE